LLFGKCATQRLEGFSGAYGINYLSVELVARVFGVTLTPRIFGLFQIVEDEWLAILRQMRDEKK